MRYRADQVLLQYLAYRRNPVGLKAQNPIEAEGLVYVDRCVECGGKALASDAMYEVRSPSGAICLHCEAPWELRKECRFIGEVRVASHKRTAHEKLGKFLDLGIQFEHMLSNKQMELEVWYYVANADGAPLRRLVAEGPDHWGDRAPETVYGVRKLVNEGREVWSAACRKIGIKV
jgi:hypothetical protein